MTSIHCQCAKLRISYAFNYWASLEAIYLSDSPRSKLAKERGQFNPLLNKGGRLFMNESLLYVDHFYVAHQSGRPGTLSVMESLRARSSDFEEGLPGEGR